uniref:separase n=1 Tax=Steinernema glaseri TaxID=37863 RepID=A0A1I7Z0Z1_9BILA
MPEQCDNKYEVKVNRTVEYCAGVLHRYFFKIGVVQEKVHNAWTKHITGGFSFIQDVVGDKHVDLINVLAQAYVTDFSGSNYIQLVCDVWMRLPAKYLQNATLQNEQKIKITAIGKILASLLILNAEYQKAVIVLRDIVQIDPSDVTSRLVSLKLLAQLGEWDVLGHLLAEEKNLQAGSRDHNNILKLLELLHRVHTLNKNMSSLTICNGTSEYIAEKSTTFGECEAAAIAYKIRIAGSRLPYADLQKIGDPIANRKHELRNSHILAKSRIPSFFNENGRNLLLRTYYKTEEFQKLMTTVGSTALLKSCADLATFFDTTRTYISDCLDSGLLKESACHAVTHLRDTLRLAVPIHLLRSTSLYIGVRQYSPEFLVRARECTEILLSHNAGKEKQHELKQKTIGKETRKSSSQSSVRVIETHKKDCTCLFCSTSVFSTVFRLEVGIAKLAHALYRNPDCEKFYHVWTEQTLPLFSDENALFRSKFPGCKSDRLNAEQSTSYVEAIARWALTLLPQHVAKPKVQELINEALEHACGNAISLRPTWLLLKQLTRLHEPAKAILTDQENDLAIIERSMNSMSFDQPTTPARGRPRRTTKTVKKYAELSEEVLVARDEEFLAFNHLMIREWRTRICSYLAQHCKDPFEKAYFLAETTLCGLRQNIRAHFSSEKETYFHSSVDDFRNDVANIPEDLTVVQLFVDHNKILWFSRIHSKIQPLTIPIADLTSSTVIDKMQKLLDENKETVNNQDSKTFWRSRKALDHKLERILVDVQNEWFGPLVHFLLPYSAKLPSTSVTQLAKSGLSKDSCKSLICAASCSNSKEEWLPLVKIICELERIPYEPVITIASTIYDKLDLVQQEAIEKAVMDKFTILNLPPELSFIHFESTAFLQDYPLICRIPSFKLFCNLINNTESVPKPVNGRKSYFVLNPGGDLPDTEKRVGSVVESYKFDGITGVVPESAQITAVLNKYDVFFYIGHGSGGRYFGRHIIRSSKCRAVSILMGCDSAAITLEGPGFDGQSVVYDYLIARCPCVVGCLWMVTDGEIDRYFVALLDYCFSHLQAKSIEDVAKKITTKRGYRTLLRGIAKAREKCHLKYLTGGAVVSYGLPVVSQIV